VLRNVLVFVLAFVAGNVVITLGQAANMAVFPPPAGFDWSDPAAVARMVAEMPPAAYVGVELSYVFGCLVCGLVIGALAGSRPMLLATIAGVVFTLAGFANIAMIPMPLAMAVLTTITYVPCTLLGALIGSRLGGARQGR
jgi:hypothetical protein